MTKLGYYENPHFHTQITYQTVIYILEMSRDLNTNAHKNWYTIIFLLAKRLIIIIFKIKNNKNV